MSKKRARDVIADNLPTFGHRGDRIPNIHDLQDAAQRIMDELNRAGWKIVPLRD